MLNMCSLVCAAEAAPAQEMCTFNPLSVCVYVEERKRKTKWEREKDPNGETQIAQECATPLNFPPSNIRSRFHLTHKNTQSSH